MHLAYCLVSGEFFTVRLMFVQISAMLHLKLVAYYTISFVRKTAVSFRIRYINVALRILRLFALVVMLQERL
jgi:hypothetical protein